MVLLQSALALIILAILIASITIIIFIKIIKRDFKDGNPHTLKDIEDIFCPSWWSILIFVLAFALSMTGLWGSIDNAVNNKIENYRNGNVSRIVNYKIKTVDGKTTVTDSTYYYRDKKRK